MATYHPTEFEAECMTDDSKLMRQTSIGTACELCQDKDNQAEANFYCRYCDKMFCDRCRQRHNFRFPKHTEVRLCNDQVKLSCPTHRKESLKHLCTTCTTLICTMCALDDSANADHKNHDVIPVDEGYEYCKEQLLKEVPIMTKELVKKKAILKETVKVIEKIEQETAAAKDSIKFFADELINTIQQWEEHALDSLERDSKECINQWQKISQNTKEDGARIARNLELCEQLNDRRNVSIKDCIDALKDMKRQRGRAARQTMQLSGKMMSHVHVEPLATSFKESLLQRKYYRIENHQQEVRIKQNNNYEDVQLLKKAEKIWELTKTAQNPNDLRSPVSVSFAKDNKLLVSEVENRRVSVFACIEDKHDGSMLFRRRQTLAGVTPKDACADDDGHVFVADTDAKCVFVFDSEGHKITSWGEDVLSYPRCLALMSQNRIAVGDRNHHQILIFSRDGQLLDRFGSKGDKDAQFQFIISLACDSKDRLIVGDRELNKVKIYDQSGTWLHTIDPMTDDGYCKPRYSIELTGVAVDECDNIYIAIHGYHQIIKYNSEGLPTLPNPLLNIKDGITYPCAVTGKSGGLIAVVESSVSQKHAAVKVFKV